MQARHCSSKYAVGTGDELEARMTRNPHAHRSVVRLASIHRDLRNAFLTDIEAQRPSLTISLERDGVTVLDCAPAARVRGRQTVFHVELPVPRAIASDAIDGAVAV